jgi:hypothetical protein
VGTWHDPDLGRPIAAPLDRCAELLGVDQATGRELATNIDPYIRADGTRVWSLMQLERQLRPDAYGRRRGGYLDRRQTYGGDAQSARRDPTLDAEPTTQVALRDPGRISDQAHQDYNC